MHVLIIPSEEFLPKQSHLAGIFQKHQALSLKKAGCDVGIISISLKYSIWMILKNIALKILNKCTVSELKNLTISKQVALLYNKCFNIEKFITKEQIDGLTVYRIEGFYYLPPSKHSNHYGWLKGGEKLLDYYCLENGIPDIIHAHNSVYAGILANRISEKYKIPYVITEHSSFIARNLESKYLKSQIVKSYLNASKLFVVSDFLGNCINHYFGKKIKWYVLPNVLDPDVENSEKVKKIINDETFTFISIGSLIPIKRHKDIIKAFQKCFSVTDNIQLMIAGDGELQEELSEYIHESEIGGKIKLLGRLDRDHIIELIENAQCLVLSSEIETFGVVIIEALSKGKPVIASSCGGPQSIINNTNGILYKVGDIDALCNSLSRMYHFYKNFDAEKIQKDTLLRYGQDVFSKKLIHEYEQLIHE